MAVPVLTWGALGSMIAEQRDFGATGLIVYTSERSRESIVSSFQWEVLCTCVTNHSRTLALKEGKVPLDQTRHFGKIVLWTEDPKKTQETSVLVNQFRVLRAWPLK